MTQRNRFLLYTANDPQEPKCEVPGNPAEKIPWSEVSCYEHR
jgi:hypothetical protein